MLPTLFDVRRLVAMRRYLTRQGFALVVGRSQPFIGSYRASVFDPSGEYCGGFNAPDLRSLVDGLSELLQPDSPLLWHPAPSALAVRWAHLRIAYRSAAGSFVLGWSADGARPSLCLTGNLGAQPFTAYGSTAEALADFLSANLQTFEQ